VKYSGRSRGLHSMRKRTVFGACMETTENTLAVLPLRLKLRGLWILATNVLVWLPLMRRLGVKPRPDAWTSRDDAC